MKTLSSLLDNRPLLARPRRWRTLTSVGLAARLLGCALPAMALLAMPALAQVGPVAPSGPTQPYVPQGFDNSNIFGVFQGGRSPTFNVPFPKVYVVQRIWTYHWNGGRGDTPGLIGLRDGRGIVTWWRATNDTPGSNPTGWDVYQPQDLNGGPYLLFAQNGPYTVLDSSQFSGQNTWSWNGQSQGFGFFKLWVY